MAVVAPAVACWPRQCCPVGVWRDDGVMIDPSPAGLRKHRGEEIQDAWRTLTGRFTLAPENLELLLSQGWTAAHVEQVQRLARFAAGHWTGVAGHGEQRVTNIGMGLSHAIKAASREEWLTPAEMLDWITVLAGAPPAHAGAPVGLIGGASALAIGAFTNLATKDLRGEPRWGHESALGVWQQSVPCPLGPLAWAAGMTMTEAARLLKTGSLTAEGLRTVASLRGWRFPADLGQPGPQ